MSELSCNGTELKKFVLSGGSGLSLIFGVSNGVRQGGILSPKLFSVYDDELSKTLSAAKTGCIINDVSVNHVFYTDNLCIMSDSLSGLQNLIDIYFKCTVYVIP